MPKVFLSYHSTDRAEVRDLADRLKAYGLRDLWLDQEQIDLSRDWVPQINGGLRESDSFVVFWGPRGFGEYQEAEISYITTRFVKKQPCMVVLLPGASPDVPLGILETANRVSVRYRGDQLAVDRIYETLAGRRPPMPDSVPPPENDLAVSALKAQSGELRRESIVFVVGPGTDAPSVECMLEIREALLGSLPPGANQGAGWAVPRIETVANYCWVRGEDIPDSVRERLEEFSTSESPTLERLASFLAFVHRAKRTSRRKAQHQQLVVSTRHDLMLERALLRWGLSFQRIVHFRSANRAVVDTFLDVERDGHDVLVRPSGADDQERVDATNAVDLNRFLVDSPGEPILAAMGANNALQTLPLAPNAAVILYKITGSIDLPDSCQLCSEHYDEFARQVQTYNYIPDQIRAFVLNRPLTFMGYSLLDGDLRLVRKTLLNEGQRSYDFKTILVRPAPGINGRPVFCQAEHSLWNKLLTDAAPRMRLRLIDVEEEDFLEQLKQRAENTLAA